MEAWILHIRTERYTSENYLTHHDKYSAWMNEKQATKAAAKQLQEWVENHNGPFYNHYNLREAVRSLIEADYNDQAIALVNEYSVAAPYKSSGAISCKVHITIEKSTFLGSPFE
jgi:hypothetical protein